ncbi:RNase A-like domain-containing protein [Oligella urethralis]
MKKGTTNYIQTSKIRVVLKSENYNGKPYYIPTAYPKHGDLNA